MRKVIKKRNFIQLEITPLIDVVFLLLIFFMLTSSFVLQTGIKVELPEAQNVESIKNQSEYIVTIKKDDKIFLNGKIVALMDLKYELKKDMDKKEIKRVIIQADKFVYYGRIIKIMDIIKDLGIKKVGLPTKYIDEEVPSF